ncbi:MAG: hypothetical protein Q4C82_06585 [Eubacteriales bacterium]|nr:hypothetical protein [Eubacteriales bacterium]
MSHIFELERQQKLAVYTEGNSILGVRLPLRRGGEYVVREGYLSDLTGTVYQGQVRLAWHSLEHHVILSGTEERSDRIILSDAVNAREYGGLRLIVRGGELYLLYSARTADGKRWSAFARRLEELPGEPAQLPGEYEMRPSLEARPRGKGWIVDLGTGGELRSYEWREQDRFVPLEQSLTEELQERLREKERQLAYVSGQYEELREIAMKLQEDGRRMRGYIQEQQSLRNSRRRTKTARPASAPEE